MCDLVSGAKVLFSPFLFKGCITTGIVVESLMNTYSVPNDDSSYSYVHYDSD